MSKQKGSNSCFIIYWSFFAICGTAYGSYFLLFELLKDGVTEIQEKAVDVNLTGQERGLS